MNDPRRIALVTGAGSGIGRATAIGLHERGFGLVLVGRSREKLEETARRCGAPDALLVDCDIADSERAAHAIDATIERFGRLDVLVNCAGIAPLAPIAKTTEELLEQTFWTNTFGPAFLIVRAWPVFLSQRGGCIVNVSTIGTSDPFPGFFAYAASKAAIDSFTRSIAREGRAAGITGYCVNPGAVETPLLRTNFPERTIPPAKALAPEAVAAVVVACACGERTEDNGRTIPLPSPA
jgi:NAD(P)-dependent dehydrogenase (short-subunit alcohol dehydrogenase family)